MSYFSRVGIGPQGLPRIPVMKPLPVKTDFLTPRIQSIAASGIFSNRGPQVRELETRLAAWLNVNEANLVVTSNATVALTAAIALSPATSWHVPAWSFPATALAPLHIGKPITFVDIDPDTWLAVDHRDDPATGLMNVIPFGGSFDQTAWSHPGEVVIDAAASLATRPLGLNDFPESAAVVFSLHATKTMGGGEGGVVIFGSASRAKQARSWINFGFSGARESVLLGTNGKMSEYDAAVANARLDGWGEESVEWLRIRELAREASQKLGLKPTPASMDAIGPYWIALFNSPEEREQAVNSLTGNGIETRLWWGEGLYRMNAFSSVAQGELPVVKNLSRRYLGLPFFVGLSESNAKEVSQLVANTLKPETSTD